MGSCRFHSLLGSVSEDCLTCGHKLQQQTRIFFPLLRILYIDSFGIRARCCDRSPNLLLFFMTDSVRIRLELNCQIILVFKNITLYDSSYLKKIAKFKTKLIGCTFDLMFQHQLYGILYGVNVTCVSRIFSLLLIRHLTGAGNNKRLWHFLLLNFYSSVQL